MADSLRQAMGPPDAAGPVCLAAESKEVVAAALLAALGGGPLLLLPHALSPQALARLQRARSYRLAITDIHRELPSGVRQLVAGEQSGGSAKALAAPPEPRRRILEIFTGGSTGSPRLWAKTVANLFAEGLFLARHFKVTEKDRIAALVVGEGVRENAVRSALCAELEPHALPRRIIMVDRIPMAGNGKYDRESALRLLRSEQATATE